MKFTTKFSLGDTVYVIHTKPFQRKIQCEACSCTGKIKLADQDFECPACHGSCLSLEYCGHHYIVSFCSTVGRIQVTATHDIYVKDRFNVGLEITYMLEKTGVCSGNNWPEDQLFSTHNLAQAECNRRNATSILEHDTVLRKARPKKGRAS
jgi:hypothetical protein